MRHTEQGKVALNADVPATVRAAARRMCNSRKRRHISPFLRDPTGLLSQSASCLAVAYWLLSCSDVAARQQMNTGRQSAARTRRDYVHSETWSCIEFARVENARGLEIGKKTGHRKKVMYGKQSL